MVLGFSAGLGSTGLDSLAMALDSFVILSWTRIDVREADLLPIPNLSNGSFVNSFVDEGPTGSR